MAEIAAGVERALSTPMTRSELVECYGTCDPVVLRERFALPEDIAAAESLAAEGVSPGVAA
ncbi:hypothetical protein [Micromonospora sediminicola]|uniref:hypothetical protein n=1 Tax=Micromonospora sediminicola TaxID=946078 RepID=UPI0037BCC1AB